MKRKNKATVLVLGASGFVGKNITEKLSSSYTLFTPPHSQLDLLDANAVTTYFKSKKIDVVIYSANVGGKRIAQDDPALLSTNLHMFFNVTRCSNYFKKMIFLGSGAEYDKSHSLIKVKEEESKKSVPSDIYGLYKFICSHYIASSNKIIDLRIFGLFGKYEDYRIRFISHAICRTLFDLPITIKQNLYFDYVSVDDLIEIITYFINTPNTKHKIYNVGGKRIDLLTIAKKINTLSSKNHEIIIKTSGLGKEYTSNNSRLKKELDQFTFSPFDKSLKKLYLYYKEHKKIIDKNSLLQDY